MSIFVFRVQQQFIMKTLCLFRVQLRVAGGTGRVPVAVKRVPQPRLLLQLAGGDRGPRHGYPCQVSGLQGHAMIIKQLSSKCRLHTVSFI